MDKKLQIELKEKHKELLNKLNVETDFSDVKNKTPIEVFGIECGNGWYKIIDNLCKTIETLIKDDNYPEVHQIKEKFGGLRFYVGSMTEDNYKQIHGATLLAEYMSYEICEKCGSTDNVEVDESGWIRTLCEECRNE